MRSPCCLYKSLCSPSNFFFFCVFVTPRTCLARRCLATTVSSYSSIPAFRRHVTLLQKLLDSAFSMRSVSYEVYSVCSDLFFPEHLMISSNLRLCLLSGLFPSGSYTKALYAFTMSLMCATFPAHLMHFDFVILIVFCEEYKL
jgi:hypothetical protein